MEAPLLQNLHRAIWLVLLCASVSFAQGVNPVSPVNPTGSRLFPNAFASADNIAAQTASFMHGGMMGWDASGGNWDRLTLDTSQRLIVTNYNPNLAADNSANSTSKVPALMGRANAANPAWTEGNQVPVSTDLFGNLRVMFGMSTATLSAWTSATGLNATQTIFTSHGTEAVIVHLVQTTTITAGAATFEVTYDGTNWVTIPANAVVDPQSTTFAQVSLPYTLQASTNKPFLILNNGWQGLRIKLSTQITGTGSVTPNTTFLAYDPLHAVVALSPTAANFNVTVGAALPTGANTLGAVTQASGPWTNNLTQFGGSNVSTGTGAGGAGIPRVTISNDSSLAANQSVNVNQINSVTPLMGNGTTGTGSQRVTIASDNSNAAGIGGSATGAAVPAAARYMAGNGSGNLTGRLQCDGYAKYDAATNGATELVALSSSKIIYVCGYAFTSSSSTANTLKLVYGTGSNCATGQTAMTPGFVLQAAASTGPVGKVVPPNGDASGLKTAASNALCVLTTAAQTAQVEVWYTQF